MNKRKTLENMWVNKKVLEKRKEKAYMKEAKKIPAKNNSTPTNSAPALSKTPSLSKTTQIIAATQTLNGDQSPPISWINIRKTIMK